jgi:magnesium transporter
VATLTIRVLGEDGKLVVGGAELLEYKGEKWIDLVGPDEASLEPLAKFFKLHRLAVEDCLHLDQRPKLEEFPDHLFMVLHGFGAKEIDICELQLQEMHFFLGSNWLLTVHETPVHAIDEVQRRVQADPGGTIGRGADYLAYMVADTLVDDDFPLLDRFSDELEDLEDKIFSGTLQQRGTIERIFALKRVLVTLRRVLSPQRDVVGLLARRGILHVKERTTLYFRDIYDHLVRLYEQIDATRDLLGNVMDAHLNMVANRTNEVTKQLTIFASIFLPMSVIVGFFGQNFDALQKPVFFWLMIASMAAVPLIMIGWFRHKRWF